MKQKNNYLSTHSKLLVYFLLGICIIVCLLTFRVVVSLYSMLDCWF